MPTRTARTGWTGTLEQGVGKVELTSSKRAAEDAGGATSPEELIAAAHSSCYAMQLSALIGEAGGTPQALDVQADVSLGPDPAGGFKLTGIKLTVRGEVDGLNAEQFLEAAQAAKAGCPVSKALTGVDITLDAALEE
jgi:lipoyl-dependent peroxiredoxin